ncbi:MAG: sulfotransferase domain-containing protein [Sulfuricaulis sp.]
MSTPTSFSDSLRKAVQQMGSTDWYFRENVFREDDIWLASYPRSGSHFARFILVSARYYLRYGSFPVDLSGMKGIPDVHGGRLEFAEGAPRILKTHFPFDPRNRRVIHLIRDPRDVVVSYFHYSKGLPHLFSTPTPERLKLPQFVELFLQGIVWPGDIREHSASFSRRSGDIAYTRIHYEHLLADPQREYRRLLSAVDINLPDNVVDVLIEHTRFSNMRRLHTPETARAGLVEGNPVYILRSGVAGQHAQVLRNRLQERIESTLETYLEEYGYR